jgi:hypothetical protein
VLTTAVPPSQLLFEAQGTSELVWQNEPRCVVAELETRDPTARRKLEVRVVERCCDRRRRGSGDLGEGVG